MRRLCVLFVVTCAMPVSRLSAQPTISSNFDASLDGWSAVGFEIAFGFPPPVNRVSNPADMVHGHTGGNPGGYAQLTDAVSDPGSFASAPSKFLGNLSAYKDVGKLSFDHRLFATGTPNSGIQDYTVFIVSGNPNSHNFMYWQSPGPTGATGWVHLEAPISAASWTRSPFATMTFDQILSNVTELLLPFELVDNDGTQNQEQGGLDNVVLAATASLSGDFNTDGKVDAADYVFWRNGSGGDYNTWRTNFGRTSGAGAATSASGESPGAEWSLVPEPGTLAAACAGLFVALLLCRSRNSLCR